MSKEENLTIECDNQIMDVSNVTGIVKIVNVGKAQQVTLGIDYLKGLLDVVTMLEAQGYTEVTLTVQSDHPIIVGGKKYGFAIAPRIHKENDE